MGGKGFGVENGECYQPPAGITHDRCGGGSVMSLGGIAMIGKSEHVCQANVTGLYHRDNVIDPTVVPYACRHGNAFIFQDDHARVIRARFVHAHLQFGRITTLPWPAESLDLSPMEHLWDILGRRVRRRPHKPQDIIQLADTRQEKTGAGSS